MPPARSFRLSRRHVLRGVGATISLPLLEAMSPLGRAAAAGSRSASGGAPVRIACLFMPNGVRQDRWTPEGEGRDFALSPILEPLAANRDDIVVLTNLEHRAADTGDGHYVKCSGWLTGTTITKTVGADINANGVSMDQVAAAAIGRDTRLPSIELGTEPPMSGVDRNVNYTTLYANHIAWKTPTTPLPCELNPRVAFDRLFRTPGPGHRRRAEDQQSILDLVLDDARSLRTRVGSDDRRKLDEYLESIRSVETRIEHEERELGAGANLAPEVLSELRRLDGRITEATGASPGSLGGAPRLDPTEHVRLMMDLMALAFWSDSTRVATFMFAHAVSNRNFSFLDGVSGSHHEISHHQNKEEQLDQYERINQWHVAQFAYFVDRLKAIREGESTLLDNSMLLFGSGLRDGNSHNPHNLPVVLAGRAGNRLDSGRHLVCEPGTPLANLYVSMHQFAGVETQRFADSDGPLRQLA